jgi:hypothetical protein
LTFSRSGIQGRHTSCLPRPRPRARPPRYPAISRPPPRRMPPTPPRPPSSLPPHPPCALPTCPRPLHQKRKKTRQTILSPRSCMRARCRRAGTRRTRSVACWDCAGPLGAWGALWCGWCSWRFWRGGGGGRVRWGIYLCICCETMFVVMTLRVYPPLHPLFIHCDCISTTSSTVVLLFIHRIYLDVIHDWLRSDSGLRITVGSWKHRENERTVVG